MAWGKKLDRKNGRRGRGNEWIRQVVLAGNAVVRPFLPGRSDLYGKGLGGEERKGVKEGT